MNILFEKLNPLVTKCGLDNMDEIEILKGPCKKIGVRPAHVVFICAVVSVASIVLGIAARFLATFVSMIYPAYRSIKAIESDNKEDDRQWLSYWILFSLLTLADSSIGFVLEFIPFYHVIRLALFVFLFHPSFNGAEKVYKTVVQPVYLKYHKHIDQKIDQVTNKVKSQSIY
ncbi:unnamed protein product (macronuclear) [Paramecium tetraurelia]|uniref:Receptor expression-enhancing protein n=1 Tax=Paramecium tetraurelia TaxID=5888 RepID=A0CCE8_PARTE|nr:uncharacterized protein GSPATT00037250001 [Paramecium tetraurelia]CAK68465.1 unnamed protein product [Paramecium tetraurelia]|eukprot:XP_001435862.1 hypothetical protein (macronuclear) [Paramecium tetraurelia strain d4-2]